MGKLIRDNIDNLIRESGKEPVIKILTDREYKEELEKELLEKVNEYIDNNSLENLADIVEVIYTIIENMNKTPLDLNYLRNKKNLNYGSFKQRKYLISINEKPATTKRKYTKRKQK